MHTTMAFIFSLVFIILRGYNMYKEITLQLNENCNLNCKYCFAEKSKNFISERDFHIFYSFCLKSSPDCVHITGGEPMLHPKFYSFISLLGENYPLVIYSNFTQRNVINKIKVSCNENLYFLVNINDESIYGADEYSTVLDNIEYTKNNGMKVALSYTFYKNDYPEVINKLIRLAKEYNISNLRISQANVAINKEIHLSSSEVKKLYSYVANNYEHWERRGVKVYFDCPVRPCDINVEDFIYLREKKAMSVRCIPKAFVRWNLFVTHCYSTISWINSRHISEFTDIVDIKEYISERLQKIGFSEACTKCRLVPHKSYCGCPGIIN